MVSRLSESCQGLTPGDLYITEGFIIGMGGTAGTGSALLPF